jgi:PAS domain S-box-containing protein
LDLDWSLTKIAAGLAATSILFLVYLHQSLLHRERHLALWTAAWGLYCGRLVLLFWMPAAHEPNPLLVLYATTALVAAYFLLWGTRRFVGRSRPVWPLWLLALGYAWTLAAGGLGLGFVPATAPSAAALGLVYLLAGAALWPASGLDPATRRLTAGGFFVWGGLQATYPLVAVYDWFAAWGYLLSSALEVWAALGLLLLLFERKRQELVRAREVLAQNLERQRRVVQSMPIMLYALDHQGRPVVWNAECERVTGHPAERMLGDARALERLAPDPARREEMAAWWARPRGDYREREGEVACADGTVRTIAWSNLSRQVPVPGWATWGVGVDVTERRRAHQGLRHLAAGVAHNFNNALMGITGNLEAASKRLPLRRHRQVHRLLRNALASAAAGREVVARLAAHVGGPARAGGSQALELACLVRTALEMAEHAWPRLAAGEVRVETSLEPGVYVWGRRGELLEVFLNLIKNALEAMPEGGRLVVEQGQDHGLAWLSFSDTGQGMDAETLERAFEPFFSTKGLGGQGLGLSSSRGILEAHHGTLSAQSVPGRGATLVVRLPRGSSPGRELAPRPAASGEGRLVLLVEDEGLVALGLEAMLADAGYRVLRAESVDQARRELAAGRPDLVLCDLALPDGSGWEVAAASRRGQGPRPRFVLLTGWAEERLEQGGAEQADLVLYKPVEREALLSALASVAGPENRREAAP